MKLSSWLKARERAWNGVRSSGSLNWARIAATSFISGTLRENLARGIASGRSHDPAAGMTAGAAQIQPSHRRRVLCRTGHGPHHQKLIERQLAVVPVAADDAKLALDIGRRQQLRGSDRAAQTRRVLLDAIHDQID